MKNQYFNPEFTHRSFDESPHASRGRRGGGRRRHDGFGPESEHPGRPMRGHGPRGAGRGPHAGGRGSHSHRGGERARRGAIRLAILALLQEGPANGYGLMKAIAEKTSDRWQPSPGSIYPALQLLTDEGLIEAAEDSGSDTGLSQLSAAGQEFVTANVDKLEAVWELSPRGGGANLREAHSALTSLLPSFRHATQAQRDAAAQELAATRKRLIKILAEDGSESAV